MCLKGVTPAEWNYSIYHTMTLSFALTAMNRHSYERVRILKFILKKFLPRFFPHGIKIHDDRLLKLKKRFKEGLKIMHHHEERKDLIQLLDCMFYIVQEDTYARRLFFYMLDNATEKEVQQMHETPAKDRRTEERKRKDPGIREVKRIWNENPDAFLKDHLDTD